MKTILSILFALTALAAQASSFVFRWDDSANPQGQLKVGDGVVATVGLSFPETNRFGIFYDGFHYGTPKPGSNTLRLGGPGEEEIGLSFYHWGADLFYTADTGQFEIHGVRPGGSYEPVATFVVGSNTHGSSGGREMQIRGDGDSNSLLLHFPDFGDPLISTEVPGTQLTIAPNNATLYLGGPKNRTEVLGNLVVDGAITTGASTNRWIFRGLTVDKGVTNAHCAVNGTNFFWPLTPE